MKKNLIITTTLFFSILSAYSQSCEAIIAENKKLKAEIASLKASGTSTSDTNSVSQTKTDGNIAFKVVSIVGSKQDQKVTVVVMVTNSGANLKYYATGVTSFISDEGEEFKLEKALLGKESSTTSIIGIPHTTLYTKTPLKTVYVFEGILPNVNKIKLLPFPYKDQYGGEVGRIEFRDLPITWK